MLQILESVGEQLQGIGVPEEAHRIRLVNDVRGLAGQNTANVRLLAHGTDRSAFFSTLAGRGAERDRAGRAIMCQVTTGLRAHADPRAVPVV